MKPFLTLDLSTTCTGFAVFNLKTSSLERYGTLKPEMKGIRGAEYPLGQLKKMRSLSAQIQALITEVRPDKILIEEINSSKNRLGQKTLDGFHFILVDRIETELPIVSYMDTNGATGWRKVLDFHLSEQDKLENKNAKAYNKKLPKGSRDKRPLVTWKTLACRFANKEYNLELDCDKTESDGDIADAICMGIAYLRQQNG